MKTASDVDFADSALLSFRSLIRPSSAGGRPNREPRARVDPLAALEQSANKTPNKLAATLALNPPPFR